MLYICLHNLAHNEQSRLVWEALLALLLDTTKFWQRRFLSKLACKNADEVDMGLKFHHINQAAPLWFRSYTCSAYQTISQFAKYSHDYMTLGIICNLQLTWHYAYRRWRLNIVMHKIIFPQIHLPVACVSLSMTTSCLLWKYHILVAT